MQHGKIPEQISNEEIQKWPGVRKEVVDTLLSYVNNSFKGRETPLFIYFNPDLESLSNNLKLNPADIFTSFKFLCSYWPSFFKINLYFHDEEEDFVYKLQEEDFEVLKESNQFHHPKKPQIVFSNPYSFLRHAFVVGESR